MYIIVNGQIIRPSAGDIEASKKYIGGTTEKSKKSPRPKSNVATKCKQVLFVAIILFLIYVFTCGKCRNIFRLFK